MAELSKPETGPGTRCPRCDGSGDHPGGPPGNQQCPECDGTGWLTPKTEQPYGMVLDDMDHQAKYQSATIKPPREQAVTIGYMDAFDIAQKGFDAWKAKEHNAKWFRRIDGTPIPNDLLSNIAEAFAHSIPAQTTSSGLRDRGERETILMYEDALGRIITEDREEHTNADGPCAKIAREAIAKSAAVPPQDSAASRQRCPACDRTDAEYKRDARHPFVCRDPWHADDHLRSKKHSQEGTD
jgi:hypothetical protein